MTQSNDTGPAPENARPEAPQPEATQARQPQDTPRRLGALGGALRSVLVNCRIGLRVLGGEIWWLLTGWLRSYESRQVRRRLEAEYAALGRMARVHLASNAGTPLSTDGEAGLAVAQIDFLEKELESMADDLRRTRKEMLARRRREMDHNDN